MNERIKHNLLFIGAGVSITIAALLGNNLLRGEPRINNYTTTLRGIYIDHIDKDGDADVIFSLNPRLTYFVAPDMYEEAEKQGFYGIEGKHIPSMSPEMKDYATQIIRSQISLEKNMEEDNGKNDPLIFIPPTLIY